MPKSAFAIFQRTTRGLPALAVVICALASMPAARPDQSSSTAVQAANKFEAGYTLRAGWNTFGIALPAGAAREGVEVGRGPTQTDVKTRWPDGSIRFAVVTASTPAPGKYEITPGPSARGTFAPKVPALAVRFKMQQELFTAKLPGKPEDDHWLAGPLVQEWRATVAPVNAQGQAHPFLRVIFDIRAYRDGKHRVDICGENTLDLAGATLVSYDLDISEGQKNVAHREGMNHFYLTRWRIVYSPDIPFSFVKPDFEPYYRAKALPRYLRLIRRSQEKPVGADFDLLGKGSLNPFMPSHGGRADLAPYPDWTARFLVHENTQQGLYVLAHGDLAGSWPVHIREADGSLVSIDRRPQFWLDGRADPQDKPRGDLTATGPLRPDNAHVPSLAYVPFLITGDRYYADEMKFWANNALLTTWQEPHSNARGGSEGLLKENETRGYGWTLRNLADAAAYLPDDDPDKESFVRKVVNNLNWLDRYAKEHSAPLDTLWEGKRPTRMDHPELVMIAPWEQDYLAWAIDHANDQGFQGGLTHRDRIARFHLNLFTSPEFDRDYGAPYELAIGERRPDNTVAYFSDLALVFRKTFPHVSKKAVFQGYWGPEARLILMIGVRNRWQGAKEAYRFLHNELALKPYIDGLPDLARRAGWAIALEGE